MNAPAQNTTSTDQQWGRSIRRLLLIQPKYLGDVLLTTPTIRAARRAFPDARIDYLVGAAAAPVLEGNPYINEVIVWRRGVRNDARLLWKLLRRRYDAVIDMHSKPRTALQTLFAGGRMRVGIRFGELRDRIYTHLFPREEDGVYMPRKKLEMLGALGVAIPHDIDVSLDLILGPEDRTWADATLKRTGLTGVVVALSPVTRSEHKQWGIDRWAIVGDAIASTGAQVLITSGPGELEQARAVAERMSQSAVYEYGPTSIRQLAALYQRCALWIGNDGGAKHLAVAAGTQTITVGRWKGGEVWSDLSLGSKQRVIERAPVLPCDFNCGKCPHISCLEQVRTPDVISVVRAALDDVLHADATTRMAT